MRNFWFFMIGAILAFEVTAQDIMQSPVITQAALVDRSLHLYVQDVPHNVSVNQNTLSVNLGEIPLPIQGVAIHASKEKGIALLYAIDVSASLPVDTIKAVKEAVQKSIEKAPESYRFGLMSIGKTPQILVPYTGKKTDVFQSITQKISPSEPQTALYESMIRATEYSSTAKSVPERKLIVLITDAMDDSTQGFGREEVLRVLKESGTPIVALVIPAQNPKSKLVQNDAIKALAELARASGGSYRQTSTATLSADLVELIQTYSTPWLVTADCSQCPSDSYLREVRLSFNSPSGVLAAVRSLRMPAAALASPSGTVVPFYRQTVFIGLGLGVLLVLVIALYLLLRKKNNNETINPYPNPLPDPPWPTPSPVPNLVPAPKPVIAHGRKIQLSTKQGGVRELQLGSRVVIGRNADCDMSISDAELSGRHFALYERGKQVMITNLSSTNGTFLNGVKIHADTPVNSGDWLGAGRTEIKISF